MIYLFTYELHPSFPRNIEPLHAELENSLAWCHYMDRTWLIATDEDVGQLNRRISRHLRQSDMWLVVQITLEYDGWLPEEAWDWIQKTAAQMGI